MNEFKRMIVAGAAIGVLMMAACGAGAPAAVTPGALDSPLVATPTEGITTLPTPRPVMESPIQPTQPTQPEPPAESPTMPGNIVTIDPALMITPELTSTPEPLTSSGTLPPAMATQNPAVIAAREALAKQLRIEPSAATVVGVEEVQWPDGCLGVRMPDVLCIQVIVPGYRITLEANGKRYVYHTDQTGQQLVLAEPRPRP